MPFPVFDSPAELQAATLVSPFGDGTTNSNVDYIVVSTTAAAYTVPTDWYGCLVTLKAIGADVYWFFSEQSSVKPDASKTARDPQLGWRLRDGEVSTEKVPRPTSANAVIYLLHDGSGAGVLWIRKSSPP